MSLDKQHEQIKDQIEDRIQDLVQEAAPVRRVKKASGTVINNKLKELGILSVKVNEEGRKRTITNEKSEGYGIERELRFFNGRPYEQIVYNDIGKEFLLNNICMLME